MLVRDCDARQTSEVNILQLVGWIAFLALFIVYVVLCWPILAVPKFGNRTNDTSIADNVTSVTAPLLL